MRQKFYKCDICGRIYDSNEARDARPTCCGEPTHPHMANLDSKMEESHIPHIKVSDSYIDITVGNENHPMTTNHSIEWISLVTDSGERKINLKGGSRAQARFPLNSSYLKSIFLFCSKHGLWKYDFLK